MSAGRKRLDRRPSDPRYPATWATFSEEWLRFERTLASSDKYLGKGRQVLREIEDFAPTPADLTPLDVARWVASLMDRGLRPASIKSMMACLGSACAYGVKRRYFDSNPVDSRRQWLPKGYTGRTTPPRPGELTAESARELMEWLHRRSHTWEGHRLYAVVGTGLYTGLRKSKLLRLRSDDCDLVEGKIETGRRWERIREPLISILAAWKPRSKCEWLFPGVRRLGPWEGGASGDRPQDLLRKAGLAIGIERLTFESLRRYWDSWYGAVDLGDSAICSPAESLVADPPSPWSATMAQIEAEIGLIKNAKTRKVVQVVVNKALDPTRPGRLIGKELMNLSGLTDAVNIFKRWAESGSRLALASHLPLRGGRGYGLDIVLIEENKLDDLTNLSGDPQPAMSPISPGH